MCSALNHKPVSGKCPLSMLYWRKRLTSGNMWVKQVVKITPPPKQERADKKNCPLGEALWPLWPILQHLFSNNGTRPRNSEMPPSSTIDMILTCMVSIVAPNLNWGQNQNKDLRLTRFYYYLIFGWIIVSTCLMGFSCFCLLCFSFRLYYVLELWMYVIHRYLKQMFALWKKNADFVSMLIEIM